ncbi:putative deoxyribonuclease TATDN1 like protein [Astathelohania contejeani]|uniref:Deoxyribonuclease TATDN1 like protein n=1 Tax=Astathelohania contejeani TaxID=164912 RepID=A0ABQ7HZX6_9MICR|nr:putative deoxyribonuclease TATDN1 like protein [Thelohania contejeani]
MAINTVDIAVNITDNMFVQDLEHVIQRSLDLGVLPLFVGLDTISSSKCVKFANKYDTYCYAGIHPTNASSNANDLTEQINEIISLIIDNPRIIAIGECGLDYDRLYFSNKNDQKKVFIEQLELCKQLNKKPKYFLHSRNCHRDFMEILSDYQINGVVHSFTGNIDEAMELIKKGYYIGINGCSLKTEEGLDLVRNIPIENIVVESDAPYCKIKRSHASYKYVKTEFEETRKFKEGFGMKSRNEPRGVLQVVEALSNCLDCSNIKEILFNNSKNLFGINFDSDKIN